jgi:UDP-glucose 4-epimerase
MKINNEFILITGGAGFVGKWLCEKLLSSGYKILVIDNLSNGSKNNYIKTIEYLNLDISNNKSFINIPNYKFKCIIHLAAQASNAISFNSPIDDLNSNQIGTYNLLEFAKDRGIKKFIYSSSMSAYGSPINIPTRENSEMLPESFYAVHKLAGEHYCRIFKKEYGIDYTIFRFYTVYGHGQNLLNVNQGLLSIYLSYIIDKKPILIKGSTERVRDIVHVTDVVQAILLAIDSNLSNNKTYNLGSGQGRTIKQLIDLLTYEFGYKSGEYPIIVENGTPGDPLYTLADVSKIKTDLNWEPKITPEDGIKLTVKSYKI